MANEQEFQNDLIEFERSRQQLMSISAQKQQFQLQGSATGAALEELKKTKEKKVYKAVGNILILSGVTAVAKELEEQKESGELRVKTLQKQEDSIIEKLNKLKVKIEQAQKELQASSQQASSGED